MFGQVLALAMEQEGAGNCTCPAGNVTSTLSTMGTRTNRLGQVYPSQSLQFDPAVCGLPCGSSAWPLERAKAVP